MAPVIYSTNQTANSVLTTTSNIIVNPGVTLVSQSTNAITATAGGNSALIRGILIGDLSGLEMGSQTTQPGHSVTVATGGEVSGFVTGMRLFGYGNVISNSGTIWSDFGSTAMQLYIGTVQIGSKIINKGRIELANVGIEVNGTGPVQLVNSGVIDATTAFFHALETSDDTITNSGTITGRFVTGGGLDSITNSGVITGDIDVGNDADRLTNTGTITGNILLGAGSDRYDGAKGRLSGTVSGGDGEDTILGGIDDDVITGDAGNDTLRGGVGQDELNGGTGFDTADYSDKTTSVVVTLDGTYAVAVDVGGIEEDSIRNIERIIGSSVGDILTGDRFANTFSGRGGNDFLDGGAGIDTLDYNEKRGAIVVTLTGATNAVVTVGGVAEDAVRNFENIIGGQGNDSFTGDAQDNIFYGRGGDDRIDGGAGNDTADFSDKTDSVVVTLDRVNVVTAFVDGVAEDTLISIENVSGGAGNDILTGDGLNNVFRGRGGNNTIAGAGGTDTLTYSDQSQGIVVTLNGSSDSTVQVGLQRDTIRSIENIVGGSGNDLIAGDSLANVLSGGAGFDVLEGGGGNDTLNGEDGDDFFVDTSGTRTTISGGAGNDYMELNLASIANGTIDGGAGNDTMFVYGAPNSTISITGLSITSVEELTASGNTIRGTVALFEGFDRIYNPGSGNGGAILLQLNDGGTLDISSELSQEQVDITASAAGNTIITGFGQDTLRGGTGADTLNGREASDILTGGAGADSFVFSNNFTSQLNTDTITDFTPVDDTFLLDDAIFTALSPGQLSSSAFRSNLTGQAEAASDRIIYDMDSGLLLYDPDGNGVAAFLSVFAINSNLSVLTAADFLVI